MKHALPSAIALLLPFARAQAPSLLPPLDDVTRTVATADGAVLAWPALLDRLAKADVVFLGETHIDDTTHRTELAVLEGLLARKPGKVVLSMEMFERDVQPVLDDYLQGRIDEAAFLQRSRPWGNYSEDYRPLVEACKKAVIPVVAANFPAALRRKLGMGGKDALAQLTDEERRWMPAAIHPASDKYWERVDRATRGHMGGGGAASAEERLYDGQNLWDNAMGAAVADAFAAHAGSVVLHVAGGFHVAYGDGTVAQFRLRNATAKVAVVEIAPVPALAAARPDRDREQADYLVYATALARSEDEGTFAVAVPAELRYRLAVPPAKAPLPLLVWLPDRDTRVEDALAFWRLALGDAAAVAVVEPAFPELQDDLAMGGRFAVGDGFRSDYARGQHGLERLVEYVARRQPVDAQRVAIAGAGDGGAVVLWAALYGQWLACPMLAVDPADLTRLMMEGLPDQRPATGSLRIAAHRVPEERLARVVADYTKVGVDTAVMPFDGGAEALRDQVCGMLGLGERARPAGEPTVLVLETELPRAREWAELLAMRLAAKGTPARVATAAAADLPADAQHRWLLAIGGDGHWPVSSFAQGEGIPLAGGPFGGTTVVVLGPGTSAADRAAWLELEQQKVVKKRNRFMNLAIAGDGVTALPEVIEQLRQRGRSRVLIVPATFCADAATMRALQQQLGAAAQGMDVSWLPGFGAELAR